MKISLILTAIIIVLFACFGWHGRQQFDRAKADYDRFLAQAREQGLDLLDADGPTLFAFKTASERSDSQTARNLRIKKTAGKLTALANSGTMVRWPDDAKDQNLALIYQEGLAEASKMDPAELKLLVDEINSYTDLDETLRAYLMCMVGCYVSGVNPAHGIDMQLYAMSRLKLEGIYKDEFEQNVGISLRDIALGDPEKAFDWLRKNEKDYPGLIGERAKTWMLSGVSRRDGDLAFSCLGELGMTRNAEGFERIGEAPDTMDQGFTMLASMRQYTAAAASDEERQIAVKSTFSTMASALINGGYEESSSRLELAKLTPEETAAFSAGISPRSTSPDTGKWIDWIANHSPADQLNADITRVVTNWVDSDYQSAGTWLATAADGPAKETAVKTYASAVAPTDPATAAQWAGTLPAGDERTALMKDIYGEWKKRDRDAAKKFAEENGIGPRD